MGGVLEEVWITGLGLVSSLGEGVAAHRDHLLTAHPPIVEERRFAPYPVHPLPEIDFSRQIPKRGDLRQMGPWQRIGTYAAGLALEDAGIKGDEALLDETHLIVAAGNGERDMQADMTILRALAEAAEPDVALNERLASELRPTLYLAELTNLLAGNISIVHKARGSSRTVKGEEMAGVTALEIAARRIAAGQGRLFLVGGAWNGEREDQMLVFEMGGWLARGGHAPVWAREGEGAGFVMGSQGAFLVLEARSHAEARGARPHARLAGIVSGRCNRAPGAAAANARELLAQLREEVAGGIPAGPLAVLSGASGVRAAMREERAFLDGLVEAGLEPAIRAWGSMLGHGLEAHVPMGVALGAAMLREGAFPPPFDQTGQERPFTGAPERILVTGFGHWRGEGLALLTPAR